MTTLKKLSQVKPDLCRVDDNCEEWDLRKWLQENSIGNNTDDTSADSGDSRRRERNWYTKGKRENGRDSKASSCLHCRSDY